MSDNTDNVVPLSYKPKKRFIEPKKSDGRAGAPAKKHGGALEKHKLRSTLEAQLAALELVNKALHERLQSMGAVLHAMVLRHGAQVFDRQELNDRCTMRGIEFGLDGPERVVLQLRAEPTEEPEGP